MSTDELLAEALRLTRVDRARVAEELLSSLEESTRKSPRHGRPNWNGVHETSLKVAFRQPAGIPPGPRS
jgi:hypothetical protein